MLWFAFCTELAAPATELSLSGLLTWWPRLAHPAANFSSWEILRMNVAVGITMFLHRQLENGHDIKRIDNTCIAFEVV